MDTGVPPIESLQPHTCVVIASAFILRSKSKRLDPRSLGFCQRQEEDYRNLGSDDEEQIREPQCSFHTTAEN